jgi:hypothetical protein
VPDAPSPAGPAQQSPPTLAPRAVVAPRPEYARRLEARRAEAARAARFDERIADLRLVVFGLGLVVGLLILQVLISPWWLLVPVATFVALVAWNGRVARARRRAERVAAYYQAGLERLDETWAGKGASGSRFLDESHPYAADLDLFGTGSLFERLCTARTSTGQATLASWLRAPAPPEAVRERQEAIEELRHRIDLREDLARLGEEVLSAADPAELAAWGADVPILPDGPARWAAATLATLTLSALLAWPLGAGPWPFVAMTLVEGAFALHYRERVRRVVSSIDRHAAELGLLSELLSRLEGETWEAPLLRRLRAALDTEGLPPSRQIAKLARLVQWLESKQNQIFLLPAALMLWSTQFAFAIESWRTHAGRAIGRWLAALGEIEALCSLATYAFENPSDPFPTLEEDGPAHLEGEGLGHPLIPRGRCVRNDVALTEELRVLIVSGSNMSGKSTLLRTVGVNAVLAQAGAPVRASRLRLSPLAIGATLRVQDSLQAGRSRFFAEITRVRQLVDIARGTPPLLFLLDEVFNGTNSHDRRLGAEAVVRSLVDLGAIGLVTTHDLALADIADRLAPRAANVHFEDRLEDGEMTFDYTMRPGVVRNSNALALMRAVGLNV